MGRKAGKPGQRSDFDPYDDFDDGYDDEIDIGDLSRDFYSTDRGDYYGTDGSFSARRKIELRRDMKKLYSQLDEWEEFGEQTDW
jgi:hypothetical protein